MASALTSPYLARISLEMEPELTPTLMGRPLSLQQSATSFNLSAPPMLPGLILILAAPFSAAAMASL
jgi:hypothetical protein